ncbi:Dehydrin COR410 [Vitis vinifera]|uniref:Dehydrin COR410 n=1 Tax=Vitis vinifera TaxID=29760 RepID=A0A438JTW6_VITVI|nr:Dehydrin COR410 [Vitis vinifera]
MADQHPQEDAPMTDVDVVKVSKPQREEKSTLTEEHHQHHSSSSSDESVPVEKCDEMSKEELTNPEEKKGFLEKLKEKLPGQHKKGEEADHATPTECAPDKHSPEKKGILEKIKEKLPGSHKNGEEKDKEK